MSAFQGEEYVRCRISAATLSSYFQPPVQSVNRAVLNMIPTPTLREGSTDVLVAPISIDELRIRLSQFDKHTAAGPSGILYKDILCNEVCSTLVHFFNAILRLRLVPEAWRRSRLTMIYKSGPKDTPRSWRPIALQECIAKLFFGILADRLLALNMGSNLLPKSQRAFIRTDGCSECNSILNFLKDDAKLTSRELCAVWIDITNAFGSVCHELLFEILARFGLPSSFIEILRAVYSNSQLLYFDGYNESKIKETIGLKQGCPISPILFNLYAAPLLFAMAKTGQGYRCLSGDLFYGLAYADDHLAIGDSVSSVQRLVDVFVATGKDLNLIVNEDKCKAFLVSFIRFHRGSEISEQIFIAKKPVPRIAPSAPAKNLGRPFGYESHPDPKEYFEEANELMEKLGLAEFYPYQILDALDTFVLPKFTYLMRMGDLLDLHLEPTDIKLRNILRNVCGLPHYVSNDFLAADTSVGGLCFVALCDQKAAWIITRACAALDSDNLAITAIARKSLLYATHEQDIGAAVRALNPRVRSNAPSQRMEHQCFWSCVVQAMRHINNDIHVRLNVSDEQIECSAALKGDGLLALPRERIYHELIMLLRRRASTDLMHSVQGRAFRLVSLCDESSYFVRHGEGLWSAEWRFALKARLDVLALNVRKFPGQLYGRCSRCTGYESLHHILTLCRPQNKLKIERHSDLLNRMTRACLSGQNIDTLTRNRLDALITSKSKSLALSPHLSITLESTVPETGENNKHPDFVLFNKLSKRAIIVDVTFAYESSVDIFGITRRDKIEYYQDVAGILRAKGYQVIVEAFVMGALGAWDPENFAVLKLLGAPPGSLCQVARYCTILALKWAYTIFYEHIERRTPRLPFRVGLPEQEAERPAKSHEQVQSEDLWAPPIAQFLPVAPGLASVAPGPEQQPQQTARFEGCDVRVSVADRIDTSVPPPTFRLALRTNTSCPPPVLRPVVLDTSRPPPMSVAGLFTLLPALTAPRRDG